MHFIDFDSLEIYGQNEYPKQLSLTYILSSFHFIFKNFY